MTDAQASAWVWEFQKTVIRFTGDVAGNPISEEQADEVIAEMRSKIRGNKQGENIDKADKRLLLESIFRKALEILDDSSTH